MSSLYLTVNVFKCKRACFYPVSHCRWTLTELKKILYISGVNEFSLSEDLTFKEAVQLLIERLNVQTPLVYAIDNNSSVILNSQDMTLQPMGKFNLGMLTVIQKLPSVSCQKVWNTFAKHFQQHRTKYTIRNDPPTLLLWTKEQKKQQTLTDNHNNHLIHFESQQMIDSLQRDVTKERKKQFQLQEKNLQLQRTIQTLTARHNFLQNNIDKLRSKLASQKGMDCTALLEELEDTKAQVTHCQDKLAELLSIDVN